MASRMGINHMTVSTVVFVPFHIFVGPLQSFYWAQDASMGRIWLQPSGTSRQLFRVANLFRMTLPSGLYIYPSQAQITAGCSVWNSGYFKVHL